MKDLLIKIREPLIIIKNEPYQFYVWLFVVMTFGLAGVWMPFVFEYFKNGTGGKILLNHIKSGSIASFGVVILADGIAATMIAVNAGLTKTTAGIRGLIGAFSVLLIMINVAILILSDPAANSVSTPYIIFQMSILLLTTAASIYLYCFKSNDWEKSAETMLVEEEHKVEEIGSAAEKVSSDDAGVKL